MPGHGLSLAQQVVVVAVVVAVALAAVEEVHLPPQPVELLLLPVAALGVVELAVVARQLPISLLSAITSRRPQSVAAVPVAAVRCPAPMWCPI